MVSPALEGNVLTTGPPGKSREVTFIHSTNPHPFHGVPVPTGRRVLGRPATWLARGRPWPDTYEGVRWKRCGRGSYKGRNCILGRLVVTSKHAYWQFLPDKLISPFFLPELLDNLPSVKARQKGPLPCSDLAVPARQAHGLRQACRPSICIIGPPPSASTDPFSSPWGPWGSIRNTSLPLSGKV